MSDFKARRIPNFLGVGAPRSGSTWLHMMLARHPEVYVPPIKEVHYFDSIDASINEAFNTHKFFARYKWLFVSRLRHYLGYLASPLVKKFRKQAKLDFAWDLRFFLPGRDIEWYAKLFRHAGKRYPIVGEITPAYIMLSDDVIKTIYKDTGVDKIIFILRDPISATWSCIEKQVRDARRQSHKSVNFTDDEILVKIQSPRLFARYNYAKNLSNWFKYFDRNQVFIGFYEELESNPKDLLSRIFKFLDVQDISSQLIEADGNTVNAARGMIGEIPDAAKTVLAQMHADQLEELANMLQGYSIGWSAEAKNILKIAIDS
jgi:hypothetical protein